jgi:hypothetical protein
MDIPGYLLIDLLEAERCLGALLERLSDPEIRQLWQWDALRREALASRELDGELIPPQDLALARVNSSALPIGLRAGALRAAELHDILAGLAHIGMEATSPDAPPNRGMAESDGDDVLGVEWDEIDLEDDVDEDDVVAAARASAADLLRFTAALVKGDPLLPTGTESDKPTPDVIAPLSAAWLEQIWARVSDCRSGPDFTDLAGRLERILVGRPGLAGVAEGLRVLHEPGLWPEPDSPHLHALDDLDEEPVRHLRLAVAERQSSGPGWAFARLCAPFLLVRATRLDAGRNDYLIWLSPALLKRRQAYAAIATMDQNEWLATFLRQVSDGLEIERQRVIALRHRLSLSHRRLAARPGARETSRATTLMMLMLSEYPAIDIPIVRRRLRVSDRGARLLIQALVRIGAIREIEGRGKAKIWVLADEI